jgi:hypothetical protein
MQFHQIMQGYSKLFSPVELSEPLRLAIVTLTAVYNLFRAVIHLGLWFWQR